jgi:hypothetical protein
LGWNVITYIYINENDCESIAQDSIFVDDCVGITETEEVKLTVYPNPARRYINVVLEGVNNSEINLEMVNTMGQAVYERKLQAPGKTFKLTIDLSGNRNGLYILKVRTGQGSYYKKVFLSK